MATRDALIGVANRVLFRERLDDAVAVARLGERGVALLMLELSKFKTVNDSPLRRCSYRGRQSR
jgi:GGDEF domain-containing protein